MVDELFNHIPYNTKQDILDSILAREDVQSIDGGSSYDEAYRYNDKYRFYELCVTNTNGDHSKVRIIVADEGTEHELSVIDESAMTFLDEGYFPKRKIPPTDPKPGGNTPISGGAQAE